MSDGRPIWPNPSQPKSGRPVLRRISPIWLENGVFQQNPPFFTVAPRQSELVDFQQQYQILSPRFRARATDFNGLNRGSTGLWPVHPVPDIFLFVLSAQHPCSGRSTIVHPQKQPPISPVLQAGHSSRVKLASVFVADIFFANVAG